MFVAAQAENAGHQHRGSVFGEYGGNGYGEFFSSLSGKIRSGDRVSWFLVLSPYLAILTIRLTAWGWRRTL